MARAALPGTGLENAGPGRLSETARRGEALAGEPRRIVGGKDDGDAVDVVWVSDATKRRARGHVFSKSLP